jgi:integrase
MGVQTNLVKKRTRNGHVRWIIDFYYSTKNGERMRFVRHAELQTRDGAEKEATRYHERAVLTGTPELEHKDVPTLRDFYRQTFEPKVLPLFRKNTRVRYQALWRQRVDKAFGAERLDAITQADLRGFVRSIELEKRTAKGPVAFVGTLLREAAQLGLIDEAPRLPPGVLKEAKKLPAAPSLAEVEHLIAKASGWVRVALGLGVYAGLRSGEIRALQARDVDLDTCLIRVVRTLSEDEEEEPKGDKERTVPVVPQPSKGTTPRRQHVLSRVVEHQRRLGMARIWSVHALRHAFCSHLVRVGVGVEAVRALAGHSSIQVTNRYGCRSNAAA